MLLRDIKNVKSKLYTMSCINRENRERLLDNQRYTEKEKWET